MFCKVARPAQAQPWPFRLVLLPAVLGVQREKPPGCPGERRQPGGSKLLLFQIIPKPKGLPPFSGTRASSRLLLQNLDLQAQKKLVCFLSLGGGTGGQILKKKQRYQKRTRKDAFWDTRCRCTNH